VSAANVVLGFALTVLGSLLQALLVAAICALAAVLTRSMLATTLVTFLVMLGQELAGGRVAVTDASPIIAGLPTIAARGVRDWGAALMGDDGAIAAHLGPAGLLSLLVWLALTAGLALLAFQSQDLSRE